MRLKQILLLALIVSWLRQTDRPTMSLIELSWTAKKEENKTTRNTCLKMQKIRVFFFLLEIQSPIICANNAFFLGRFLMELSTDVRIFRCRR